MIIKRMSVSVSSVIWFAISNTLSFILPPTLPCGTQCDVSALLRGQFSPPRLPALAPPLRAERQRMRVGGVRLGRRRLANRLIKQRLGELAQVARALRSLGL